jgi:hypothetical protein
MKAVTDWDASVCVRLAGAATAWLVNSGREKNIEY